MEGSLSAGLSDRKLVEVLAGRNPAKWATAKTPSDLGGIKSEPGVACRETSEPLPRNLCPLTGASGRQQKVARSCSLPPHTPTRSLPPDRVWSHFVPGVCHKTATCHFPLGRIPRNCLWRRLCAVCCLPYTVGLRSIGGQTTGDSAIEERRWNTGRLPATATGRQGR